MRRKGERRLYRFFNIKQSKHGEPFCMCDFHYKSYVPPLTVIMETIADHCRWPCTECDEEELPEGTEGALG